MSSKKKKERTPQTDMRPSREAFLGDNVKLPENPLDDDAREILKNDEEE